MQNINCNVFECKHCNCDLEKCKLNEIKVCNCDCIKSKVKEETMCASYEKKD